MDIVDVLKDFAAATETAWSRAPDGPRKEVLKELADVLREAAVAKLNARRPEGAPPVVGMTVFVGETNDDF